MQYIGVCWQMYVHTYACACMHLCDSSHHMYILPCRYIVQYIGVGMLMCIHTILYIGMGGQMCMQMHVHADACTCRHICVSSHVHSALQAYRAVHWCGRAR